MASQTRTTTDHEQIKAWVEDHDGVPSLVRDTGDSRGPGVLRIDFPGGSGEDVLEHVDWDEWFAAFENSGLAFLYQEQKSSGADSTFFKLVNR